MTEHPQPTCFRCGRDEHQVPLVNWSFRGETLTVCPECMPMLIHKWQEVALYLEQQRNPFEGSQQPSQD